jgi:hypothetical protein
MRTPRWICLSLAICAFASSPMLVAAAELLPPDRPIQEAIDHYVELRLNDEGVTPASQADDANLIRRTTLDLVGRIPTVAETAEYVQSSDDNKRAALVERLMTSPAFVRHQATEFDTLLMYGNRGSLRNYLLAAIQENRPWDRMFREMLLGDLLLPADADPVQKEAMQFVAVRVGDLDKLVNETSVTFFGVNVSCAQCHDHPLVPEWTQEHFYGMKSFVSRTFDNGGFLAEREYGMVNYKTTKGESRDARLMFLTGTVVDEPATKDPSDKEQKAEKEQLEQYKKDKKQPPPPKFSRRTQLADVALRPGEDQYFARAIVNNLWYRFYGYGLVMPLDQMHPENEPSHPELLDWLARDLIAHHYDLRRLVEGLVLSRTYARSSRWDQSSSPPSANLFAVARVRPLSPQQYATSLRLASTNPDVFDASVKPEDVEKRIEGVENSARGLAALFEQPREDFEVSVAEALLLNNSDRVANELLRDAGDSLIGKLKTIDDPQSLVDIAVRTIFNRAPDSEEQKVLEQFVARRSDQRDESRRQLVWALLTSSECRFNY